MGLGYKNSDYSVVSGSDKEGLIKMTEANKEYLISERGRALIIAAAVLDRPNADPDDDLAVLARQLTRAQEEIDSLTRCG